MDTESQPLSKKLLFTFFFLLSMILLLFFCEKRRLPQVHQMKLYNSMFVVRCPTLKHHSGNKRPIFWVWYWKLKIGAGKGQEVRTLNPYLNLHLVHEIFIFLFLIYDFIFSTFFGSGTKTRSIKQDLTLKAWRTINSLCIRKKEKTKIIIKLTVLVICIKTVRHTIKPYKYGTYY